MMPFNHYFYLIYTRFGKGLCYVILSFNCDKKIVKTYCNKNKSRDDRECDLFLFVLCRILSLDEIGLLFSSLKNLLVLFNQ